MKFDMRHGLLLTATLLAALTAGPVSAQMPDGIPLIYQGEIWVNGAPLDDGTYDLVVEFVTSDTNPSNICGSNTSQSVDVVAGKFTFEVTDPTCRTRLATAVQPVWIRVAGRGGDLGTSISDLGFQKVSAGVYSLRTNSGGLGIGDIVASVLDETDFNTVHGGGWMLADGQSAAGTRYAALTGSTNVPDLRGVFLRGHKGAPARPDVINSAVDIYQENTALGGYQSDQLRTHSHSVASYAGPVGGTVDPAVQNTSSPQKVQNAATGDFGQAETRPKTVVVNYYIRVD
ncbi:MAG: hypothetical protein P1V51_14455 [Deltaproteobacteria bacterium]|nr:hypothetical protein [Deltaproteobacteria bacterium]